MPLFAIVDIETTGGTARFDRITEIGIVLHDGQQVVEQWTSLINPECEIPYFITRLTGITNEMVADAPKFYEVAQKILRLTEGAVFVAHNVRFDYDFVRREFEQLGYTYTRKQLCTVRLTRQAFPGLPSYSLGNLIKHFKIRVADRHRALADAAATADIFGRICQIYEQQGRDLFGTMLPAQLKEAVLPLGWTAEKLLDIPEGCGVYYFHDALGHVVYVGKSIHIRKRVLEHFKDRSSKAAKLQHVVADITCELTGSELAAELLEALEIKRLQPTVNKTQRAAQFPYAIFAQPDAGGYLRFLVEKNTLDNRRKYLSVTEILRPSEARHQSYHWADMYRLCLCKTGWQDNDGPCFFYQVQKCDGACLGLEDPEDYNARVTALAQKHGSGLSGSFLVIDKGRSPHEAFVVAVHEGQFAGFGYFDTTDTTHPDDLANAIKPYPTSPDIQRIIRLQLAKRQAALKILPLTNDDMGALAGL